MAVWFGAVTPNPVGSVTVTGCPFEPVGGMFWGVHTALTTLSQTFGAASDPAEQWTMWMGVRQQTAGYNERHRELRNDSCILLYDTVNHTIVRAQGTLTAWTSDGFTMSFTGSGSTQPVFYMLIGGKNISDAHAGTVNVPSGSGTVSVTAPGFQPKALVLAHHLAGSVNTQLGQACWGIGVTDGVSQHANFAAAAQGVATLGYHIQRTDSVIVGAFGADAYAVGLDSFDTDGFTLGVIDPWVADNEHGYLAIDCAAAAAGTSDFPDSTGVVSYPTPGLEPAGVLFTWNGADAPSTTGPGATPVRPGVGGMDGVTILPKEEGGSISGLHRALAPFGAYQPLQTWMIPEAVHIRGQGSQVADSTLLSAGAFQSFSPDQFELDWTTATANSRQFGWLALPGEVQAPWVPHIYRRVYG